MTDYKQNTFKLLSKSWIFFFALLCSIGYELSSAGQKQQYLLLAEHHKNLEEKKIIALKRQKVLHEQVASHEDPRWIELTLKKELGVVSERERKVFFSSENNQ